ncbi:uncharacterized protein LOC141910239 isoform X9 [Tubulanus polymorphus]|uniref:uncharacterized protein LOC141910239 isoform X9 n=1 Tax=Tubulanus polymorphus TaxID=672921 RepID=UPI003DA38837
MPKKKDVIDFQAGNRGRSQYPSDELPSPQPRDVPNDYERLHQQIGDSNHRNIHPRPVSNFRFDDDSGGKLDRTIFLHHVMVVPSGRSRQQPVRSLDARNHDVTDETINNDYAYVDQLDSVVDSDVATDWGDENWPELAGWSSRTITTRIPPKTASTRKREKLIRYVTEAKPCCGSLKCAFAIITVILLLVAFACTIYFSLYGSALFSSEDATAPGPVLPTNPIIDVYSKTYLIQLTMVTEYSTALANSQTIEYQNLSTAVINYFNDAFYNTSLSVLYNSTRIKEFRNGSVIADAITRLNDIVVLSTLEKFLGRNDSTLENVNIDSSRSIAVRLPMNIQVYEPSETTTQSTSRVSNGQATTERNFSFSSKAPKTTNTRKTTEFVKTTEAKRTPADHTTAAAQTTTVDHKTTAAQTTTQYHASTEAQTTTPYHPSTEATTEPQTTTPYHQSTEPQTTTPYHQSTEAQTTTPYQPSTKAQTTTPYYQSIEAQTTTPYHPSTEAQTTTPYHQSTEPQTTTPYHQSTEPQTTTPYHQSTEAQTTTPYHQSTEPQTTTPYLQSTEPQRTTPYHQSTEAQTTTPYHQSTEPQTTTPYHQSTEAQTTTPYHQSTEPQTTTPYHQSTEPQTTTPYHQSTEPQTTTPYHQSTEPQTTTPYHQSTEAQTTTPYYQSTEPQTTTQYHPSTEPQTTTPHHQSTEAQTTTPYHQSTEPQRTTPYHQSTERQTTTPYHQSTEPQTTIPYHQSTEPQTTTQYLQSTEPQRTTPYHQSTEAQTTIPYHQSTEPQTTTPYHQSTEAQTTTPYQPSTVAQTTTPYHPSTEPQTLTPYHPSTEPQTTTPYHQSTEAQTTTPYQPSTVAQTTTPYHPSTEPQINTPYHPSTEPQTLTPYHPSTEPQTTTPYHQSTEAQTTTPYQPSTVAQTTTPYHPSTEPQINTPYHQSTEAQTTTTTNLTECSQGRYRCSTGRCISQYWLCDGYWDCLSGEDERNCTATTQEISTTGPITSSPSSSPSECSHGRYRCSSGRCISQGWLCDGDEDCPSGDDERNCTECPHGRYRCSSGRCISQSWLCDGVVNCPSGEDERNCTECPQGRYRCSSGRCISQSWLCDGDEDCPSGDDERNCTACSTNVFDCGNGTDCVSSSRVCDGFPDCPNGRDEAVCFICLPGDFKCATGNECVSREARCDGRINCTDRSDELNCPETCGSWRYLCKSSGRCIDNEKLCNEIADCDDLTDELGCDCSGKFNCTNGLCLTQTKRCNGFDECGDNSDESNCMCSVNELRCPGGDCILNEWKCDGFSDCKDGWDELNCGSCQSTDQQFTCADYTCVAASSRCDGVRQCTDGSDERDCVKIPTTTVNSSQDAVQVWSSSGVYLPLCATDWNATWADDLCQLIGKGKMLTQQIFVDETYGSKVAQIPTGARKLPSIGGYLVSSQCNRGRFVRLTCKPKGCGKRDSNLGHVSPYMIGGDLALAGEYPWMASLYFHSTFRCGASLINSEWLVTAAHCFDPIWGRQQPMSLVPQYFSFFLGTIVRNQAGVHGQRVRGRKIIVHPTYSKPQGLAMDIALVRLAKSVPTTSYIEPICLPDDLDFQRRKSSLCYVSGWGDVDQSSKIRVPLLRDAKMRLRSDSDCKQAHGDLVNVSTALCAGYLHYQITACAGDSGSPLVCLDDTNSWRLVGVVSAGFPCRYVNAPNSGSAGKPDVYTRVSAFQTWIRNTISAHV